MGITAVTIISIDFDRFLCDECGEIFDAEIVVERDAATCIKCPVCDFEYWFMMDLEKIEKEN